MPSRRNRYLLAAVAVSVAIHLLAAALVVVLPRVLPHEPPPREQGTVELLMVEQKGAQPEQAGQPPTAAPAPPATKPSEPPKQEAKPSEPPKQEAQPSEPQASPSEAKSVPAASSGGDEPPPPPKTEQVAAEKSEQPASQPPAAQPAPPAPEPVPPAPQKAPVFDFAGTESESNAVVLGGRVLPASPDNRFRNRPPIFPQEAEARGEHGAVVVVIHVSAEGTAMGVDVVESSGVNALDEAAVEAVRKWHFHPAMRAGLAVPFDMPFRFIFEAN